jgi:hypothetical protein
MNYIPPSYNVRVYHRYNFWIRIQLFLLSLIDKEEYKLLKDRINIIDKIKTREAQSDLYAINKEEKDRNALVIRRVLDLPPFAKDGDRVILNETGRTYEWHGVQWIVVTEKKKRPGYGMPANSCDIPMPPVAPPKKRYSSIKLVNTIETKYVTQESPEIKTKTEYLVSNETFRTFKYMTVDIMGSVFRAVDVSFPSRSVEANMIIVGNYNEVTISLNTDDFKSSYQTIAFADMENSVGKKISDFAILGDSINWAFTGCSIKSIDWSSKYLANIKVSFDFMRLGS